MPEGLKFDGEKCRMELFPPDAYEEICNIFTFGAKKYGDHNWLGADKSGNYDPSGKDAIKYSRILGALKRHLIAREKGNIRDEESGCYTMAHVAVNAIFLLTYDMRKFVLNNDIPPVINNPEIENLHKAKIKEEKEIEKVSVIPVGNDIINSEDPEIDEELKEQLSKFANMEIPFEEIFKEVGAPEYFESDLLGDDEKDPDNMAYFYFDKKDGNIRCIDMNSSHYDEYVKDNPVGVLMNRDEYKERFSELFKLQFTQTKEEQEKSDGEKKEN